MEDKDKFEYIDNERKSIIRSYRKSHIARFSLRLLINTVLGSIILTKACFSRGRMRKEARRMLRREGRTGFLEGSIIQNPLYIPSSENQSCLQVCNTLAGKWEGYDFNRTSELGKSALQLHKGKLVTFLLDKIAEFPKDKYTPTRTFNLFDPEDILHIEFPSIDYVLEHGLLEEVSYGQAYENVGRYDEFSKSMATLGIEDKHVYQITPKGNGLVFLSGEGGSKRKSRKKVPELKPAFA